MKEGVWDRCNEKRSEERWREHNKIEKEKRRWVESK